MHDSEQHRVRFWQRTVAWPIQRDNASNVVRGETTGTICTTVHSMHDLLPTRVQRVLHVCFRDGQHVGAPQQFDATFGREQMNKSFGTAQPRQNGHDGTQN